MCQFCHDHGEGKTWYLKANHYAEELLSNLERRRYIQEFIRDIGTGRSEGLERELQRAAQVPAWLRRLIFSFHERRYRRDHFGQVVPLEDVEQILSLASSIHRIPCVCRKNTRGVRNAEYCFGLGLDPERLIEVKEAFLETFRSGPEVKVFERLSKEEALALHREFGKRGLVHTVWTFKTPFIGGLCNCDRADCLAMLCYRYDFRIFFRGETVAAIEPDRCSGCRACLGICQFGAIGFSFMDRKGFIDPVRCYGCGICRNACEFGAIRLLPRHAHPVARKLW